MDPASIVAGGHPDIHQQHQFPGDLSPDLAGLLGGGMGAPGEASGPTGPPPPDAGGGPPPDQSAPPDDSGGPAQSEAEAYDDILNKISDVMQMDTVTEQERQTLMKASTLIQGVLASNEKMHQQAGANPVIQKAMMGGG